MNIAIYTCIVTYLVLECKFSWTKSDMYASYHPSQLYLPLGSFKYLHVSLLPQFDEYRKSHNLQLKFLPVAAAAAARRYYVGSGLV